MREHNYPARFYEYVRNTIHELFTDTESDQMIEGAFREHFCNDRVEEEKKRDINDFKFLSK